VLRAIDRAVEREASYHSVSKSFVIAVVLARAFRVDEQELYE
jgi:hypothetical protein